ncbi:sensor histidine kinase [Tsuneonella amylolytica]|uniref:sensor histidine kinase n=1 Tax=Tsuneonella amylolytica TaxID=2338327 RepID=UPI0013C4ACE6|nr:histidine kinase [Tsuneonella amylolytica]
MAFALVLFALAFTNWWWDYRLAWPSLVLDVVAFLAAVYFTEGVNDDFTSPFLAFFAYLMLVTTIRWNWRVTAATGIAVTALYLLVGLGLAGAEIEFDNLRFGRRISYMLVLTLILIWFGLQRREQNVGRFIYGGEGSHETQPPLEESLGYAIEQTGAQSGAIAWIDREEPHVLVRTTGVVTPISGDAATDLAPDTATGDRIRLVSADRRRSLRASRRGRPVASERDNREFLADRLGMGTFVAIPFETPAGRGELLMSGIPGVCVDHVQIGGLIAREVEGAFHRHASLQLAQETALARTRDALARDLHDSVAQSLAGAALRLEGLRKWIAAGHDPEPEIAQIKDALRSEQVQVRDLIERLRDPLPAMPPQQVDLCQATGSLADELAVSWNVVIDCRCEEPVSVDGDLAHGMMQMLREAVANAVRHGGAGTLAVALAAAHNALVMTIDDDGTGFAADAGSDAPRSIRERTSRLGGTLTMRSGPAGTHLRIEVPLAERV